jgi:hypothetical protein
MKRTEMKLLQGVKQMPRKRKRKRRVQRKMKKLHLAPQRLLQRRREVSALSKHLWRKRSGWRRRPDERKRKKEEELRRRNVWLKRRLARKRKKNNGERTRKRFVVESFLSS